MIRVNFQDVLLGASNFKAFQRPESGFLKFQYIQRIPGNVWNLLTDPKTEVVSLPEMSLLQTFVVSKANAHS